MDDLRDRKPADPTDPKLDPPAVAPSDASTGLEAELAALREELQQANERWLRERADGENLKRRAARERTEAVRFGTEALIKDLLPMVDNLERAVRHAQSGGDGASLIEGVSLVLKSLHDVLGRHGVTRVEAAGGQFDPAHHEAVAHIESAAHAPNAVIEEHQPGYRLHDRLLRPALVTVAKSPSNLANPGGGD
jgi:molecular chaperone GrpE